MQDTVCSFAVFLPADKEHFLKTNDRAGAAALYGKFEVFFFFIFICILNIFQRMKIEVILLIFSKMIDFPFFLCYNILRWLSTGVPM